MKKKIKQTNKKKNTWFLYNPMEKTKGELIISFFISQVVETKRKEKEKEKEEEKKNT